MAASYKKLWKLLIDKDMKKKDLRALTGLSSSTIAKMTKNETVSTDVLVKICAVLNCDVGDIMEFVPNDKQRGYLYPKSEVQIGLLCWENDIKHMAQYTNIVE